MATRSCSDDEGRMWVTLLFQWSEDQNWVFTVRTCSPSVLIRPLARRGGGLTIVRRSLQDQDVRRINQGSSSQTVREVPGCGRMQTEAGPGSGQPHFRG